jgi:tartrate-resistant acid phosphatase type 5
MSRLLIESLERRRLLATSGLNAVYFNNSDFTGSTVSRNDKSVAFTWKGAAPASGISGTTFSVRWNGLLKPYTSETYTFIAKNNDGIRLWVDGKLLIDSWKSQATATRTATIALKANRLYDLRVEHFADSGGSSTMQLQWDTPTRTAGYIPSTRLFAYDTRGANVGDYGYDNSKEADVARMIKKWKPDYVTTVGDNNQLDADGWSNFDRVVGKYYREFIGNYKGSYGAGSSTNRFWPAMGNHDWDGNTDQVHKDYFTLPNNERYYDVRKGSIHFFIVSSDKREPDGTSSTSKQAQWIKSKMLASGAPFKVVVMHHPPYTSGTMGDNTWMRWPVRDWGADVVLSGHEHAYERLSVDGVPHIVNGAGGTTVGFGSTDSRSIVRNNADVGALLISANEYAMTLQYQHRSGKVIDTITIGPSPATTATRTAQMSDASLSTTYGSPATPPRDSAITSSGFDAFSATRAFVGPLPAWSTVPIADDEDGSNAWDVVA